MKIAIIGAGITGLSAAYDLTKAGHSVTMFESAPVAGGLAAGFQNDGWQWSLEHFYHHWFETDADILGIIDELGLKEKVIFSRPTTSFYADEMIHQFDSPLSVLTYPKLTMVDKMRFGLVGVYLRLTKNWQALEKETAHNWLRRTMGVKVYETLWEPLLIGKFGEYYKDVNMAWFWARIHKRSSRLGYFEGGFQVLSQALTAKIQDNGGHIHLNTATSAVLSDGDNGFQVEFMTNGQVNGDGGSNGSARFDRVLATVSPPLLSQLVSGLPSEYLSSLKKLDSLGALVIILSLKHKLTDEHYWINVNKSDGFPFLALIEHTNFMDRSHYNGDNLIYLGDYLPSDHPFFSMSKEELLPHFLPWLSRFNPDFDEDWIKETWLFRAKYAQPVPPVNHGNSVPPLETPIPGLYWACMSQVYPWDRGTNYAVEIGRRAANVLLEDATVLP